jgi:hypothetical protein
MTRRVLALLPLLLVGVAGCGPNLPPPSVYVGWYKGFGTCREEYAAMDARVAAAGVGDAAYYRVPGYPYLRIDRLLASYAKEIEGPEQTAGWIRRMRELDQESREFEYLNLGMTFNQIGQQRDRFLNCSRSLATFELEDPGNLEKLKSAVQPDDGYSGVARAVGLYPLAVPLLRSRIRAEQEAVRKDFDRPLPELDSGGVLTLWSVKPPEEPDYEEVNFRRALPDEFGLPGLTETQWLTLTQRYAPSLWIETASEADRPGLPRLTGNGADVDSTQPLVNYSISFSRFGKEPVMQITYFFWFRGNGAPSSPAIDGLLWRVTLDMDTRPLAYETLHASGHSHYWFPVQPLPRRESAGYWQQAGFFPQGQVAEHDRAVRLKAGSHAVRRVVPLAAARAERTATYELRRYEDLYTLPLPSGGSHSLFGPDGVVPGSAGPDPSWIWSSGVRNPGALKQYGHHTPAYVGREHFDAPFLLESVFIPPTTPPAAPPG